MSISLSLGVLLQPTPNGAAVQVTIVFELVKFCYELVTYWALLGVLSLWAAKACELVKSMFPP
jgi:hypothetical protein